MRTLAAVCLVVLAGCSLSIKAGDTRESLVDSGALRFVLYEYERDGLRYAWIPTWHKGGILGVSTSKAAKNRDRSILVFRGDTLLEQIDMGVDRAAWIAKLKEHKADFGDEDNEAIVQKRVLEGMTVSGVLFSWGPSNGRELSNPNWNRPTAEINKIGDEVLWYSRMKDRAGSSVAWTTLYFKEGQLVDWKSGKRVAATSGIFHR